MKIKLFRLSILIAIGLLLTFLSIKLGFAQGRNPGDDPRASGPAAVEASSDYIPIQGQLTDDSGNPLNGEYAITL